MPSPNISAIVSFSRELRNAREFNSISLSEIESITRIARTQLEAIETARWDDIPVGFLRGYIALYAKAVGMNTDKVLRDLDNLLSPSAAKDSARFVDNSPLLKQPERVGVTRSKIAAAWFADLTAQTHLKQVISLLVLAAILIIPAWIRKSLLVNPPEIIAINQVVSEYRNLTHGPQTTIPLDYSKDSTQYADDSDQWVTLNTSDKGRVTFTRDKQRSRTLNFRILETLNIQYDTSIIVDVIPPRAALVTSSNPSFLTDSTSFRHKATYRYARPKTDSDSTKTETSVPPLEH